MDMVYGWITDFEHIAWQFNSPTEFDFTNARTEDDEDQVLFLCRFRRMGDMGMSINGCTVVYPKNGWFTMENP